MQMVDSDSLASNSTSLTVNSVKNGVTHTSKVNGFAKVLPNEARGVSRSQVESESEPLDKLVEVSITLLRQAIDLVNESLSEDGQLTMESKFIPGSTIGKHLRHATEHFSLLLDSLAHAESQADSADQKSHRKEPNSRSDLELSYDVRARGTPMEGSRLAARDALETCIRRLRNVTSKVERDRVVKLTAVTPYIENFKTSFGRELWFAALHAVHHWSMVRVIAGELGIRLEDSFGVAPSTLVYRGSEGPLGKAKI